MPLFLGHPESPPGTYTPGLPPLLRHDTIYLAVRSHRLFTAQGRWSMNVGMAISSPDKKRIKTKEAEAGDDDDDDDVRVL